VAVASSAMDLGITGKRAAVAAATAGLGLATARTLADEGARVVICGRHQETLDEAVATIGHDAVGVVADVGTPDGATGFVEAAIDALGGLDILVTNAGGPPLGTFESTPLEQYAPALDLNLLSVVAMCQAAVPTMRAQRWGRVVAITSVAVRQPIAHLILSNTARAGATGFLKTLALEVVGDGVTVNSVQPGSHATARLLGPDGGDDVREALAAASPSGTIGEPDDFGAVVTFLCSQQANFITGAALSVDGGTYKALL
jgi:3-oxoacyl-[acyl-carrier protein] reductase